MPLKKSIKIKNVEKLEIYEMTLKKISKNF